MTPPSTDLTNPHPIGLSKLIAVMNTGSFSFDDLRVASQLPIPVLQLYIQFLKDNEIGQWKHDGFVEFTGADKVKAAVLLCRLGVNPEEDSEIIGWRDFEDFACYLLRSQGYIVETNVRLKKPRAEIDLIASSGDSILVVDCKHWGRTVGPSTMRRVVERQVERTYRLRKKAGRLKGTGNLTPVILTLHVEDVLFILKVPIVPISKFSDFLLNINGYLDRLMVLQIPKGIRWR